MRICVPRLGKTIAEGLRQLQDATERGARLEALMSRVELGYNHGQSQL